MVFGVKYCGGCNARYNRTAFFDRLKKQCPEIEFQYVRPKVVYDHLLVICGCPSKCADISDIQVTGDIFKISEASQFDRLLSRIREI
jgi:predicted SnoaL-like aldol condensation-catalyzing enzyme